MKRAHIRWLSKNGVLVCLAFTACTSDPYQGIYEGIENRNEALKPPEERATSTHLSSYDQYKKERERMKQDDTNKAPKQ